MDIRKLNLGCPRKCMGYVCIDLTPRDENVIKADVYDYLRSNSTKYDEIYSKNLLEHLPNVKSFIELCRDQLKKGGKITLITDNAEFVPYYFPFWINHTGIGAHAVKKYAGHKDHGNTMHYCIFTKMHLENLLQTTGFQNIRTRRITFGARLLAEATC